MEEATERAERALLRLERAVERGAMHEDGAAALGRDDKLRARVAEALGELDAIISESGRG